MEEKSTNGALDGQAPSLSTDAVLKPSAPVPESVREVSGVDFNNYKDRDITVAELVSQMSTTGFQASAVTDAVRIINDMVSLITVSTTHHHLLPTDLHPAILAFPLRPNSRNNNLPRLHLQPRLLRPPLHPPLPRPTCPRLRHRNHSRRHRRRPNQMPSTNLPLHLHRSRRLTPLAGNEPHWKSHCTE